MKSAFIFKQPVQRQPQRIVRVKMQTGHGMPLTKMESLRQFS